VTVTSKFSIISNASRHYQQPSAVIGELNCGDTRITNSKDLSIMSNVHH